MRYVGWTLGGLFLMDGLMAMLGGRDLVKRFDQAVGKKLPDKVEKKLHKATDINDTAVKALGINNLIAGAGMLLVATLAGTRRAAQGR